MNLRILSFLALFVLLFSMGSCDNSINNSVTEQPIPGKGNNPIPFVEGTSYKTHEIKQGASNQSGTKNINWNRITPVLKKVQRKLNHKYVALFSVIDSTGKHYSYHLQKLTFSDKSLKGSNGKVRPFLYEVTGEDGLTRLAVAFIPDSEWAKYKMSLWLQPKGARVKGRKYKENLTAPAFSTCQFKKVDEYAICRYNKESGLYYDCSPVEVYKYICPGNGGSDYGGTDGSGTGSDDPWNWPDDSGGGPSDGSGGTGDSGCDPNAIFQTPECEEEEEIEIAPPEMLDDDYVANTDTTDINCNGTNLIPSEKAWCASSIPQGETLTKTNNALNNIEQRGQVCAEIAQKGGQLLNEFGLRYYPSGTIPFGGRGGPNFGVLLSDVWIKNYLNNVANITDSDGTKVKINFEFALAHEIEHAMGRGNVNGSNWRTPNVVQCTGL